MQKIDAPNLKSAVQFLKELRIQLVGDLPHYGNYGLFFNNNEITTGLMNNQTEIKINLLDGSFHYYEIEFGTTIDITQPDSQQQICNLIQQRGLEIPEIDFKSVPMDQLHRYREFSVIANRYLELVRMKLKGQYSHVYLWGHNFDFDLVWYSSKGEDQIDIGISPGDVGHPMPYLYITPRPFKNHLLNTDLPIGKWVSEGWMGILVEWEDILSKPQDEAVALILELYALAITNFD